ncbi:hypothetical protein IQ22_02812 [Pseudomonas duriflava]|uniref:Coat protein n=1 Tax=Pseudomonas duriflava TaxID=459528 RepID=A0A562Q893_9PSED|nr:hypothetical protein [Pseudomonas duriflava]TWI52977.1 hypothetical protein IQ22_02812 [Pseudomonas duriflava]
MPTVLSDVVFQDELRDYMQQPVIEQTNLFNSGILARNNEMNALLASPSNVFNIPFWLSLDSTIEPNYSNDVYEDIATPLAIATAEQTARAAYLNEGWATMNLVKNITNQDPLDFVAGQLVSYWQRQAQRRVIATAMGVYNNNVASNGSDMVVDAGGTITAEAIIRAKATMGDYTANALGAIAMHSAVFTQLSILNLIDFTPIGDQVPLNGRYQGMTVIIDDGLPVIAAATEGAPASYISIVFKGGAIGYAEEQPAGLDGLAVERVEARGNGGGVETLWSRRDMLVHPFGYKFLSATITGNTTETRPQSASWADLALATNWQRTVDRKQVPIAFIRSTAA